MKANKNPIAPVASGMIAFLLWGFLPIYWKALKHVPSIEVLAHRILWAGVFVVLLLAFWRRLGVLRGAFRDLRSLWLCLLSASIISINWLIYIWAVANGFVLETSLGYFINPLLSVLLGMVFLGERFRRLQKLALLLAALGVLYLTISFGKPPWIALGLATSFGFYGLLRKIAKWDSLIGLALETLIIMPVVLAVLVVLEVRGEAHFLHGEIATSLLLIGGGVVTAVPLLLFAHGARRLRLSTIGLLQYLAPTCQFLLAVFVFGERFTRVHLVSFSCIWLALILYSTESMLVERRNRAKIRPQT